ncbi:MAG TPA: pyridoxamine 5'-phosphate oxidase family protein, partial [Phototrophicaceae bacterium]|nr:pyridoxamine 5'-phosphate oxidase family protein [Phototrophicaceae bacterium]
MKITDFTRMETEFIQRVHTMVWCSAATIDSQQRPRSRILHPMWEVVPAGDAPVTGWITTHRDSHKSRHLAVNPYVSLAYITNVMRPVYIDCRTEWVDDLSIKQRVWEMFKNAPEPLGFDPAQDFIRYDHPNFGLLKLIPWRIDLVSFPAPSFAEGTQVWSAPLQPAPIAAPFIL